MKFITSNLLRFGIEVTWVDVLGGVAALEAALRPNTKLIYVESPANPLMTLTDIHALGQLGEARQVLTCVDGTFASPLALQPVRHAVDFSVHSWWVHCITERTQSARNTWAGTRT